MQESGESLKFASNDLENDKEVVLADVQEDCTAFFFAKEELFRHLVCTKQISSKPAVRAVGPTQGLAASRSRSKSSVRHTEARSRGECAVRTRGDAGAGRSRGATTIRAERM